MKKHKKGNTLNDFLKCFVFCIVMFILFGCGYTYLAAKIYGVSVPLLIAVTLASVCASILIVSLFIMLICEGEKFASSMLRSLVFTGIAFIETAVFAALGGLIAVLANSSLKNTQPAESIAKLDSIFNIILTIICYALILMAFGAAIVQPKFKSIIRSAFVRSLKSYLTSIIISVVTILLTIVVIYLTGMLHGVLLVFTIRAIVFAIIYGAGIGISFLITKGENHGSCKPI